MDLSTSTIANAATGTILRDKTVPGLHLKVTPTGKRFFLYFRTKGGVERRPKLGDYPIMSVAQARQVAKDLLLKVAMGEDPIAKRQDEKIAPTVKDAIDEYEKKHAVKRKSGKAAAALLRKYLEPKLGSEKVASIEHRHMARLHDDLSTKTPILANRVVQHTSKLFNLCITPWGYRTAAQGNPCKGIERNKENKRRRYMTADEARAVAAKLDHYKAQFPAAVAYIYLLILTGTRRGEVWKARREWLDGNVLRLPDSKTGAKSVYLPPAAMEVIARLPVSSGTIVGIGPPYKLWYKVRKEAGCPDLRLHDLRHSFASAALASGLSLAQIGELLGHHSTQTTMRYAHLMEDAAHAAVAQTAGTIQSRLHGVK